MKHTGRKLIHLLGGPSLLALYYLLGRRNAILCFILLILLVLSFDIVRLKTPVFNKYIQKRFGSFIRKNEKNKLTGMFPYLLGAALTLLLFKTAIATASIMFLACGDVMATTVGERYGTTKISGEKSLEGTLAFFITAVLLGFFMNISIIQIPFGILFIGALVATVIEMLPLPLNDNLSIPLISGAVMMLLSRIAFFA